MTSPFRPSLCSSATDRSVRQLALILERTADGAMIVDENGKVVFWNPTAERLLGFKAAEVIGLPCHQVLQGVTLTGHMLCSPSCPIRRRIRCGHGVRHFNMQTHTKAKRLIWLNVSSLPVPTQKGGYAAIHLFRDITKQAKVRRLVNELHAVLGGDEARPQKTQLSPRPEIPAAFSLSEREREVLRLMSQGLNTKRIADVLYISPTTVRNHIQHILEKLGAHTRLEALAIAFHPVQQSEALSHQLSASGPKNRG